MPLIVVSALIAVLGTLIAGGDWDVEAGLVVNGFVVAAT